MFNRKVLSNTISVLLSLRAGNGAALEMVYDSMEMVPAEYRALFTEQDGKAVLTGVNGMRTNNDVANLQTALQKERNDHKATKQKYAGLAGKEPAEIIAALDEIESLRAQVAANGDVDKIVAGKLAQATAPLQRELDALKAEKAGLEEQVRTFEHGNRVRSVGDTVRAAISKSKAHAESFDAINSMAMNLFEVNDEGQVVGKANAAGVMAGATVEVWLTDLKRTMPFFWPDSQGAGGTGGRGGNGSGNNPFTAEHWNLTEQGRILREDRNKAEQLAKQAGTTIGGGKPKPRK